MIIPDIIETFLNSLDFGGRVLTITNDGTNTTIGADSILYARQGLEVSIDGTPYQILTADYSTNTFTVSGVIPTAVVWQLDRPIFLHGTPYLTNTHFTRAKQAQERMTPLIYLLEIINRRDQGRQFDTEEADLLMFFLDDADAGNWLTDDHYSEVIIPMDNLAEFVQANMQDYSRFVGDFETQKVDHVNFGQYVNLKGHLQSIFDAKLSGVERRFNSLPIFKDCCC